MVDTQDLKSCGHYGCAGSSPAPGTTSITNPLNIYAFRGFNCVNMFKFHLTLSNADNNDLNIVIWYHDPEMIFLPNPQLFFVL